MTSVGVAYQNPDPDSDRDGRAGHVFGAGGVMLDRRWAVLASRITTAFLAEAGWAPHEQVLRIDPQHPLLGRRVCPAPGCQTTCSATAGVCLECRRRLAKAGLGMDDFRLLPPPHRTRWLEADDGACAVTGCPRPWVRPAQPLCTEHRASRTGSMSR